jgi:hypothetical protein
MSKVIPKNARAPQAVTLTITRETSDFDLTTVTAASIAVVKSDGSTATWSADIVAGATASSITIKYTLASDGSDVSIAGKYTLTPVLTVPSGQLRGTTDNLFVQG